MERVIYLFQSQYMPYLNLEINFVTDSPHHTQLWPAYFIRRELHYKPEICCVAVLCNIYWNFSQMVVSSRCTVQKILIQLDKDNTHNIQIVRWFGSSRRAENLSLYMP